MADLTAEQRHKRELDRQWQKSYADFKQRTVHVGPEATLASSNFEVGDTLFDDSTYEITESSLGRGKDGATNIAVLTAIFENKVSGQSPWSELKESRRNTDTRDFKRFQVTFTGSSSAVRPRRGQTYKNITGTTSTLTGDGVELEPRIAQVVDTVEITRLISHTTVVFEAPWPRQGSLASTKNYICTFSRQHWADEGVSLSQRDTGVERYYVAPDYEPRKVASKLRGRQMRGTFGDESLWCYDTIVERQAQNDTGHTVTARYAIHTAPGSKRRKPGESTTEIEFTSKEREVKKDLNDKIIVGPYLKSKDPRGHGLNYMKIVRGSNVLHEGRTRIILKTAYERSALFANEIGGLMSAMGCVNNSDMPNFGNFPRGTLLLLGAPHSKIWDESNLWYANFVFEVCPIFPLPWNEWTQTQRHTKTVTEVPVFTRSGLTWTKKANSLQRVELEIPNDLVRLEPWIIDKTVNPVEPTRLFYEVDFGQYFYLPVPE